MTASDIDDARHEAVDILDTNLADTIKWAAGDDIEKLRIYGVLDAHNKLVWEG